MHDNSSLVSSKSSCTPHDNPPIFQSKYPILDSHSIKTCNFKENPLDYIYIYEKLVI